MVAHAHVHGGLVPERVSRILSGTVEVGLIQAERVARVVLVRRSTLIHHVAVHLSAEVSVGEHRVREAVVLSGGTLVVGVLHQERLGDVVIEISGLGVRKLHLDGPLGLVSVVDGHVNVAQILGHQHLMGIVPVCPVLHLIIAAGTLDRIVRGGGGAGVVVGGGVVFSSRGVSRGVALVGPGTTGRECTLHLPVDAVVVDERHLNVAR
mmetsp:Transcript_25024/g.51976  ORF Transcript_25024/g.51976 Transcript_25024/m.51976 type:complete len:208 (+) Transcript_25024:1022-1645(+)